MLKFTSISTNIVLTLHLLYETVNTQRATNRYALTAHTLKAAELLFVHEHSGKNSIKSVSTLLVELYLRLSGEQIYSKKRDSFCILQTMGGIPLSIFDIEIGTLTNN